MRTITFICLMCLGFLTAQAEDKPVENGFSMEIEGVACQVEAYQTKSPIILEPLVDKDSLPKSQLITAILLTHSDISSYMSDEDIFGSSGARVDPEKVQEHRAMMKERYEMTGPSAADNPWKGMKYVLEEAFIVNSEKGRFFVYHLSTQGGKDIVGKITSSLENIDGKWSIRGSRNESKQAFQKSMMELVPAEFAKRQKASAIRRLPLESLLN